MTEDRDPMISPVPNPDPPALRAPHWGYREVLALVAVGLLSQMLATVVGLMIAEQLGASGTDEAEELLRREPLLAIPVQFLGWLPVLAYLALVVQKRYGMPLGQGLAWITPPSPARSYVRLGIMLALGSMLASIAIADPSRENPMQELLANRDSIWILAAFGVLVAPVFEEVLFRGFLFNAFEHAHGRWTALAITSVTFAALHGAQYGWQWQQLSVLLAVGTVFGAVRIQSGSCKASAIAHATYNGLVFLVFISFGEQLG